MLIRTGAPSCGKIVAANPYDREDPTKVVVAFLEQAADAKPAKRARPRPTSSPRGCTVKGTEIYLDLPGGQARSKLLDALDKQEGLRHRRRRAATGAPSSPSAT